VYYVFTLYIIAGLTMVIYTRSVTIIIIPHINPIINFNAVSIRIIYTLIIFSWACYFKVKFTLTLKILTLKLNFISLSLIMTLASILNFFSVFIRWINLYFLRLNLDPWRFIHVSYTLYARSSV
jgi:hypothetical protein